MHPFALTRADDPAEAVEAHSPDARLAYNAGGTDLLGLMKDRGAFPERLPDINELPDMGRIEELPDGGLRIGAAGPDERCGHGPDGSRALSGPGAPISRRRWPAMQQVAAGLGLLRAARLHAIFGWSEACVATNPSRRGPSVRGP